ASAVLPPWAGVRPGAAGGEMVTIGGLALEYPEPPSDRLMAVTGPVGVIAVTWPPLIVAAAVALVLLVAVMLTTCVPPSPSEMAVRSIVCCGELGGIGAGLLTEWIVGGLLGITVGTSATPRMVSPDGAGIVNAGDPGLKLPL